MSAPLLKTEIWFGLFAITYFLLTPPNESSNACPTKNRTSSFVGDLMKLSRTFSPSDQSQYDWLAISPKRFFISWAKLVMPA